MKPLGANPRPRVRGEEELPGRVNYLIGQDPNGWRTDIPTYARVRHEEVYPGVDLVYYGNQRQLEYDFVVAPGADPDRISLGIEGAERAELDSAGDLLLHVPGGVVRQGKPVVYQEADGGRVPVPGEYEIAQAAAGQTRVGFRLGAYDHARPLVIDPTLVYATYLGGGNGDIAWAIAADSQGNAYLTGQTQPENFPTPSGRRGIGPAGDDPPVQAFVTKINPAGTALVYSTLIGGKDGDFGLAITVDSGGNAIVGGRTTSPDFPVTANAIQSTNRSTTNNAGDLLSEGFVLKLNPAGSAPVYSTYFGGEFGDHALGVATDGAGRAYLTGRTSSPDFLITNDAFQDEILGTPDTTGQVGQLPTDAFLMIISADGGTLDYSSYFGGSVDDNGFAIDLDPAGNIYFGGSAESSDFPALNSIQAPLLAENNPDGFVASFSPGAAALRYSTFLGGSTEDRVAGIDVDAAGAVYVGGTTESTDFPTTAGAFRTTFQGGRDDTFVTKINPAGSALVFSTYLGGSDPEEDAPGLVAVDSGGNVWVAGRTSSGDFPIVNPFQGTPGSTGDLPDVYISQLNPAGSALLFSTFYGGTDADEGLAIARDGLDNIYVAGLTDSTNFPATPGVVQPNNAGVTDTADAIIIKILGAGEGPVIKNCTLSPVQLGSRGGNVTVTARVTDDKGVEKVSAVISGPFIDSTELGPAGNNGAVITLNRISGNATDGTYRGTFTAPPNTGKLTQTYSVTVMASDISGNTVSEPCGSFNVSPAGPPPTGGGGDVWGNGIVNASALGVDRFGNTLRGTVNLHVFTQPSGRPRGRISFTVKGVPEVRHGVIRMRTTRIDTLSVFDGSGGVAAAGVNGAAGGRTALITGEMQVTGFGRFPFEALAVDRGSPGAAVDRFELALGGAVPLVSGSGNGKLLLLGGPLLFSRDGRLGHDIRVRPSIFGQ
jgi:hypothetical protein